MPAKAVITVAPFWADVPCRWEGICLYLQVPFFSRIPAWLWTGGSSFFFLSLSPCLPQRHRRLAALSLPLPLRPFFSSRIPTCFRAASIRLFPRPEGLQPCKARIREAVDYQEEGKGGMSRCVLSRCSKQMPVPPPCRLPFVNALGCRSSVVGRWRSYCPLLLLPFSFF